MKHYWTPGYCGHLTHDPLWTVLEGADVAHPVAGAGRGEDLLRGGEVSVPGGVARPAPGGRGLVVQRAHLQHQHGHGVPSPGFRVWSAKSAYSMKADQILKIGLLLVFFLLKSPFFWNFS